LYNRNSFSRFTPPPTSVCSTKSQNSWSETTLGVRTFRLCDPQKSFFIQGYVPPPSLRRWLDLLQIHFLRSPPHDAYLLFLIPMNPCYPPVSPFFLKPVPFSPLQVMSACFYKPGNYWLTRMTFPASLSPFPPVLEKTFPLCSPPPFLIPDGGSYSVFQIVDLPPSPFLNPLDPVQTIPSYGGLNRPSEIPFFFFVQLLNYNRLISSFLFEQHAPPPTI